MYQIMELINVFDYEAEAPRCMTKALWDFLSRGTCEDVTLRENRAAFDRVFFRPKTLVDVSERDISTTVLGQKMPMPILVAPLGAQKLYHPEGEVAIGKAAASLGVTMVVSTVSSAHIRDIVKAAPQGNFWFQLYPQVEQEHNFKLIEFAEEAGCKALVITVDAVVTGAREQNIRNKLIFPPESLPKHLESFNISLGMGNVFFQITWKELEALRTKTSLPIVLKGILREEDAKRAVDTGVSGIIVSNHGGRQLDSALSALEALPSIRDAVGDHLEILFDSGIRRGSDILKAIALGAKAVLIGRPIVYGLAVNGERGVKHILEILKNELERDMALLGCRTIAEITRDLTNKR